MSRDARPEEGFDNGVARHALDELFLLAHRYRSSTEYDELLRFVSDFRFYSPFNAMLVHVQMPGARFVASASRWARDYDRHINVAARPLVILQPKGPVMFVFDVSDTTQQGTGIRLPKQVDRPFDVRSGHAGSKLSMTIENAHRDGIDVVTRDAGSQSAGEIRTAAAGRVVRFQTRWRPREEHLEIPIRYEVLLNSKHSDDVQYATLVHELAHLYCGHLGTRDERWWPSRLNLRKLIEEFEAESVCFLVCARAGIDNPSDAYLAAYCRENVSTPEISLDTILKASGLIEQMGRERLKQRPQRQS